MLLLDRLRDYVGAQEYGAHVQPGEHFFGPDSAAAHTQWAYNNGHGGRTNHHTHGRDALCATANITREEKSKNAGWGKWSEKSRQVK